jgi:hypothetical protein
MTKTNQTPREYSAARRGLPFGMYRQGSDEIRWDVVKGLIAVTRGVTHYVVPGLLFGVVEDDDGYSIASYWHIDDNEPWTRRIYALRTLRTFATKGELTELRRGLRFEDVAKMVHREYPKLQMPSMDQFYGQFGLCADQVENINNTK